MGNYLVIKLPRAAHLALAGALLEQAPDLAAAWTTDAGVIFLKSPIALEADLGVTTGLARSTAVADDVDATLLECADDAEASARALFDAGEHDAATACIGVADQLIRRRRDRHAAKGGA